MTVDQLEAAKTREEFSQLLVITPNAEKLAFYNKHTKKNTKRFSTYGAGMRQCTAVWDALAAARAREEARDLPPKHKASLFEGTQQPADPFEPLPPGCTVQSAKPARSPKQPKAPKPEQEPYVRGTCPRCKATDDQTAAALEGNAGEDRSFCHRCTTEYYPETGKIYKAPALSKTRSEAIAGSWAKEEVKEARSRRHNVTVTGSGYTQPLQFRSVREAFVALGLPISKHIPFRMKLKAEGKAKFDRYNFTCEEV